MYVAGQHGLGRHGQHGGSLAQHSMLLVEVGACGSLSYPFQHVAANNLQLSWRRR